MIVPAHILSIPLPVIAGALAGSIGPVTIFRTMRRLTRKLDLMNQRGMVAGIRSKLKIRSLMTCVTTLRNTYLLKKRAASTIQTKPQIPLSLFHQMSLNSEQNSDSVMTPELEKVLKFYNVKSEAKFENAILCWKQRTSRKIAEGSYEEIYQFRNIDGTKRIFKCVAITGKHMVNSYSKISLPMALPDIVSSKCLSDLNEGYIFGAPNFPIVYNICFVRDHFPELLNRAREYYENSSQRFKDPTEHPRSDENSEPPLYLTIESSFFGEPVTVRLFQNAWLGVSIVSQITSALAVAEAAYNFEHRDLRLENILVESTSVVSLKYTIHKLHFSIETVGYHVFITDFTRSRICNDGSEYWVRLDETSKSIDDLDDPNKNIWLDHKFVQKIMAEYSKGRWDKYMPITNIIWLKHVIETILSYVQKKNPHFTKSFSSQNELKQMAAFRLLKMWNNRVLNHLSAANFLQNVILKDNPIVSVYK